MTAGQTQQAIDARLVQDVAAQVQILRDRLPVGTDPRARKRVIEDTLAQAKAELDLPAKFALVVAASAAPRDDLAGLAEALKTFPDRQPTGFLTSTNRASIHAETLLVSLIGNEPYIPILLSSATSKPDSLDRLPLVCLLAEAAGARLSNNAIGLLLALRLRHEAERNLDGLSRHLVRMARSPTPPDWIKALAVAADNSYAISSLDVRISDLAHKEFGADTHYGVSALRLLGQLKTGTSPAGEASAFRQRALPMVVEGRWIDLRQLVREEALKGRSLLGAGTATPFINHLPTHRKNTITLKTHRSLAAEAEKWITRDDRSTTFFDPIAMRILFVVGEPAPSLASLKFRVPINVHSFSISFQGSDVPVLTLKSLRGQIVDGADFYGRVSANALVSLGHHVGGDVDGFGEDTALAERLSAQLDAPHLCQLMAEYGDLDIGAQFLRFDQQPLSPSM